MISTDLQNFIFLLLLGFYIARIDILLEANFNAVLFYCNYFILYHLLPAQLNLV